MKKLLSVLLILLGMAMAFIVEGQEQASDSTIRIAAFNVQGGMSELQP